MSTKDKNRRDDRRNERETEMRKQDRSRDATPTPDDLYYDGPAPYVRPDDYENSRFYERRYRNRPYAEEPYRGIEYSDRGRINSVYRNPDYGSREAFEHNSYRDFDQQRAYDMQEAYRPARPTEPIGNPEAFLQAERDQYMAEHGHNTRGGYPSFAGRPSHRGKGPKGYVRSDERIMEDACDSLFESHDVDATNIEVSVNDGVVILSGTVDSKFARRNAESAVDYVPGIRNLENRLHVESHAHSNPAPAARPSGKKNGTKKSDSKKTEAGYLP